MTKVFIDGREGTTGLKIEERLKRVSDVELVVLSEDKRKDPAARKYALQSSDVAVLCLPDEAAKEAVSLAEGSSVRIIDASTAHRTEPGWAYGFPELSGAFRQAIAQSARVAVPGCHASGVLSLVYPLVSEGVLPADYPLTAFSLTGYTGGGKKMIKEYAEEGRDVLLDAPRQYATAQKHKHLPEIVKVAGLSRTPVFCPIVADFPQGMEVTVPLFADMLSGDWTAELLREFFCDYYAGQKLVSVSEEPAPAFLSAGLRAGKNDMKIFVSGGEGRLVLSSVFDNLGKGASGAAVQCMNIMLKREETEGLL